MVCELKTSSYDRLYIFQWLNNKFDYRVNVFIYLFFFNERIKTGVFFYDIIHIISNYFFFFGGFYAWL